MYIFLKVLLGIFCGIGIGWLSVFLNNKIIKYGNYLNNPLYCVVIFFMKLFVYFIVLIVALFVGLEFMLSVAISITLIIIIQGIWNFVHDQNT